MCKSTRSCCSDKEGEKLPGLDLVHTAMQSYEQACIHVDGSLSINENWHATLLQTSTPGGGRGAEKRGEERRGGPGRAGNWGSLRTDDVAASLRRLYLSQRSPFTHATTTLHVFFLFFFAQKKGKEVETCSRLRQLRKETPTNSIFKSNAGDHYIRLMSLRSDA